MKRELLIKFPKQPQICRELEFNSVEDLYSLLQIKPKQYLLFLHPRFKQWCQLEDINKLEDGSVLRIIEESELDADGLPPPNVVTRPEPSPVAASPSTRSFGSSIGSITGAEAASPLQPRSPSPRSGVNLCASRTSPAVPVVPSAGGVLKPEELDSIARVRERQRRARLQKQSWTCMAVVACGNVLMESSVVDIKSILRPSLKNSSTVLFTRNAPPQAPKQSAALHSDAQLLVCATVLTGHEGPVLAMCVACDRLVTASQDHTLRCWNLRSMVAVGVAEDHRDTVRALATSLPPVATSPDAVRGGYVYSASRDHTVRVWSIEPFQCIAVLPQPKVDIHSLLVAGGHLFGAGEEEQAGGEGPIGIIRVWDASTFQCLRTISAHKGTVFRIAVCGEMLLSAGRDHYIKVWDLRTLAMRRVLRPPHYDSVTALAVLRGRLYSGSRDKIIKEWDLSTLHATRYAEAHNDWVMDLLSADRAGLFFSAARDGIVKMWDAESLQFIDSFSGDLQGSVNSLALYGPLLITAGNDRIVRIWRFRDLEEFTAAASPATPTPLPPPSMPSFVSMGTPITPALGEAVVGAQGSSMDDMLALAEQVRLASVKGDGGDASPQEESG